MSAQILPKRRAPAMRRLALAAIGISLLGLSGTTLGADLRTVDPSTDAIAVSARHATAHRTEPLAIKPKTTSAFVDRLYKELMDWTPAPCLLGDKQPTSTRPIVRSFVFPP